MVLEQYHSGIPVQRHHGRVWSHKLAERSPNMAPTEAISSGNDMLSPQDDICLTEGQHRTLCVSNQLPDCLRPPVNDWHVDQFKLITELYHGKISLVHEAVHKTSGIRVAIKQYKKKYLTALAKYQIEREVRIHISLDHPHIVKLLAVFEDPDLVYIVQEFAPVGDLFEALKRQSSMMYSELETVGRYMQPCLQAIQYMHERRIIHRDIKPENILLGEGGAVKLADFGLAINQEYERPVTRAGTLDYMAPEVLVCPDKRCPEENKDKASLGYDEQVDAWAVGCLAAELITGSPPFESESRSATYQMIMYREPKLPARLSDEAKSFISACLNKSAKERATVQQLLQHEWIFSNARAFHQQVAATEKLAPTVRQTEAAPPPPPSLVISHDTPDSCNSSSTLLACNHVAGPDVTSSRSSSNSARTPASHAAPNVAAVRPGPAESTDTNVSPAATHELGLNQAANSSADAAATAIVPHEDGTLTDANMASLEAAVQAAGQPAGLSRALQIQQACCAQHDSLQSIAAADNNTAAAGSACALEEAPAKGPFLALAAAAVATVAVPAAAAAIALGIAAEVPAEESNTATGDSTSSSSGCAAKTRLARASSHHGHRLHKLFYPHDRHRRSSYYNCNTQWEDFIGTSSHSFTSSVVAVAGSKPGEVGDSATAELGSVVAASGGATCTAAGLQHGYSNSCNKAALGMVDAVTGLASSRDVGSLTLSSSAGSSTAARGSLVHPSLLAALPAAGSQAPAAVMEHVLSSAASGALHLLAANDLEDLIALNPAPSDALTSLGLADPLMQQVSLVANSSCCCSAHNSSTGASAASSNACSSDGAARSSTTRPVLSTLTGSNMDDFIAPSASPGGSRVSRLSVLISRSASAANLSLLASAPLSPAMSVKPSSAVCVSSSLMIAADSPRNSRVKAAAAVPTSCRPPEAAAGSYCTLQPQTSLAERASSAVLTLGPLGAGRFGAASAAPDHSATSAKPMTRAKSGVTSNLKTPGIDALATDANMPGAPLRDAEYQSGRAATPTGSSRKSVMWADATAASPALEAMPKPSMSPSPPGTATVQMASGVQRSVSCAVTDVNSSSCLSLQLHLARQSGRQQQHGCANSRSNQISSQLSPSQLLQQQGQWEEWHAFGADYYHPPSGVLSSDLGVPSPAKRPLSGKAALSPVLGPHRTASSCPAGSRAAAACTPGQVQGMLSGPAAGSAASGVRSTSRAAEGQLANSGDAAAAACCSSGVFDATVSSASVGSMLSKSLSNMFQTGGQPSRPDDAVQSACEQRSNIRRTSSTDVKSGAPSYTGLSGYRRCRGSSSGADECDVAALRQQAKSFTAGCGSALAGNTAATGRRQLGARCRRSSSDAENELDEVLAARQRCESFTAGMAPSAALQGGRGSRSAASACSHGALKPTKQRSFMPNGKVDLHQLRSKSLTGTAAAPWPQ